MAKSEKRISGPTDLGFQMRSRQIKGFTLVEILLIVAVIAILGQLAITGYAEYVERARVSQAVTDIVALSAVIGQYQRDTGNFPPDLAAVGNADRQDPWGRPYQYLNLSETDAAARSRRDRNMNPLNTDFDLFSVGKDGVSKKQISNKDSLDDVIRANDGAFINLASKFAH